MSDDEQNQTSSLLMIIEQLLAIEEPRQEVVLSKAAMLIAQAVNAEKADIFLYEETNQTLIAQGISSTPLGQLQQEIGMHHLPLANGGRSAKVFQTGKSYRCGNVEQDPEELPGIKIGMGVRSAVAVPLLVAGERRGVLQVDSTHSDAFNEQDECFLLSVAHWMGMVMHRTDLLQQVATAAAEQARRGTAEELMTVLAHDLRNYLTPLRGRLDLLKRRARKEQRETDLKDVAVMERALRRLGRMIDDLLDMARLSQGMFILSYELFDLTTLIKDVVSMFQTSFVRIETNIPAHLMICGDIDRLQQALENIISNAIQHAPKDTTISIQAHLSSDDHRHVLIAVSDQGPGIPQELIPTLFEAFHVGAGSGLGLGLYLASQIAQAHRGNLSLDSTYHNGTRFIFSIPCPGGASSECREMGDGVSG